MKTIIMANKFCYVIYISYLCNRKIFYILSQYGYMPKDFILYALFGGHYFALCIDLQYALFILFYLLIQNL